MEWGGGRWNKEEMVQGGWWIGLGKGCIWQQWCCLPNPNPYPRPDLPSWINAILQVQVPVDPCWLLMLTLGLGN